MSYVKAQELRLGASLHCAGFSAPVVRPRHDGGHLVKGLSELFSWPEAARPDYTPELWTDSLC